MSLLFSGACTQGPAQGWPGAEALEMLGKMALICGEMESCSGGSWGLPRRTTGRASHRRTSPGKEVGYEELWSCFVRARFPCAGDTLSLASLEGLPFEDCTGGLGAESGGRGAAWGGPWLLRGADQASPAEPQTLSPTSPPSRVLLPQLTCLLSRPSHHSAGQGRSSHPETLATRGDQGGKRARGAAGEARVPPSWVWGLGLLVFLLGLSDPF